MAQTVSETNGVADVTEPEPSTATISGGHLVAKALKAEGIDVIFTLCGGHIIDIYDGCVDEGIAVVDVRHEQVAAHAADGYARMTGKPGCAVVTMRPRHHRRGHRCGQRLPGREPDAADRRPGCAEPAQDGFAAGPAARRHDDADHQVRRHGAAHRPGGRHGLDGVPGVLQRRPRPVLPGDPARHPGQLRPGGVGDHPRGRPLPGVHQEHWRPGQHRGARRPDRPGREARSTARHPGMDCARQRRGDRLRPQAQHPGVHERFGAGHPAAR